MVYSCNKCEHSKTGKIVNQNKNGKSCIVDSKNIKIKPSHYKEERK